MANITLLTQQNVGQSGASTPLDTSAYSVLRLNVVAKPMPAQQYSPSPVITLYIESSRDGVTFVPVLQRTLSRASIGGPDAWNLLSFDVPAIPADAFTRFRWSANDPDPKTQYTLACSGTAQ